MLQANIRWPQEVLGQAKVTFFWIFVMFVDFPKKIFTYVALRAPH